MMRARTQKHTPQNVRALLCANTLGCGFVAAEKHE